MALPSAFLDELKQKNDIYTVVSSYVNLKRSSRNFVGLCPFHSEKSPSFTVFSDTQSYYCFGCGSGGDVITFIKNIENLEYIEAVKLLAQRAGMRMPEDGVDDAAAKRKEKILKINKLAARFFHNCLVTDQKQVGLNYFLGRGMTPKTIKHFGLGFAPDSWNSLTDHLKAQGFSDRDLADAGVAKISEKTGRAYDYFRNRVMFPIIDLRGNVIGFGGRVLGDEKPKYLNSPDTPVFKKTRNLFGMNFAKNAKADALILVEGNIDVISLHQAGFENTVATLGTALTDEQARLISGYTRNVIVAYDSDGAGQKATARAFSFFEELGVKVQVLSIPDAKDPDEYIRKFGAQRFKLLLEGSRSVTDHKLAQVSSKYDVNTPSGRVGYLKDAAHIVADIVSPIERDVYIRKLATDLGVSHDAIGEQVKSILKNRRRNDAKKDAGNLVQTVSGRALQQTDPERAQNPKAVGCEDTVLALLFKNPDRLEAIRQKLSDNDFVTEAGGEIFRAIENVILRHELPDMTRLSDKLGDRAMARLARILANAPAFDERLLADCIDGILAVKNTPTDIAAMPDTALAEYMKQLKNKKK